MKFLKNILGYFLTAAIGLAATVADEMYVNKRNTANTAPQEVTVAPVANAVMFYNATYVPVLTETPQLKAITISGQSLTGTSTTPALSIASTWNTTGAPNAISLDVTDTASASTSNLLNLKVGTVSKASVSKGGLATVVSLTQTATGQGNGIILGGSVISGQIYGTEAGMWIRGNNGAASLYFGGTNLMVLGADFDLALKRESAGLFSVRDASDTGYRDLKLRAITQTGQSLTGTSTTPALSIASTWNTTGAPDAISLDVTDTASASTSNLLNLKVGTVSKAKIDKGGSLTTAGTVTPKGRLVLPMGEINYFDLTGTAVAIVTQSTTGYNNAVVATPATALTTGAYEFDNGGSNNGRLRYTGTTTRMFHVAASVSFSGGANDTFTINFVKTGTVLTTSSTGMRKMGAGGDVGSIAIHAMVELATNDYLELAWANLTNTDDPTVHSLNLFAVGM